MMDVKKGADGVSTPARDAVEWFVENESDRELDEETVSQWEEWCARASNNAAYADIIHMRLQIRLLSAPRFASREDLLRDVLAEDGPES
jgi:ferric-dicitrate binding protein FerR (iron transport regulator)